MYLYVKSSLDTDISPIVGIHSQGRQEYPHFTQSISWHADGLATSGARASAAMVLISVLLNIPSPKYMRVDTYILPEFRVLSALIQYILHLWFDGRNNALQLDHDLRHVFVVANELVQWLDHGVGVDLDFFTLLSCCHLQVLRRITQVLLLQMPFRRNFFKHYDISLLITCHFSPKYSQKSLHSSPVRVSYGVLFVSL